MYVFVSNIDFVSVGHVHMRKVAGKGDQPRHLSTVLELSVVDVIKAKVVSTFNA
jgi:hypothetical protein